MADGVEYAAERAILVRLVVELLGSVRTNYFNDMDLSSAIEATILGNYVFLAQHNGGGCTVSDLARITGLSRASVRRRLAPLVRARYFELQTGRKISRTAPAKYVIGPMLAKPPGGHRMLLRRIALVQDAAAQLAKLAK